MEDFADFRQPILRPVEMDKLYLRLRLAGLFDQRRTQAIIRANEKLLAQPGGERAAQRAHPRIDNCQVDSARREIRRYPSQRQGALQHVLGLDLVGNICKLHLGSDTPDDAFHYPHIAVFETEIG